MTPENRGNQPASPQPQPNQSAQPSFGQPPASRAHFPYNQGPGQHFEQGPASPPNQPQHSQPQPVYQPEPQLPPNLDAKKLENPALLWGGLALGLVIIAAVVVLVII